MITGFMRDIANQGAKPASQQRSAAPRSHNPDVDNDRPPGRILQDGALKLLPQPIPPREGRAWLVDWQGTRGVLRQVPVRSVGWADEPPMEEIGALLARYHVTASQIKVASQRPSALPLTEVPGVLLSRQLEAARVRPGQAAIIRQIADQRR